MMAPPTRHQLWIQLIYSTITYSQTTSVRTFYHIILKINLLFNPSCIGLALVTLLTIIVVLIVREHVLVKRYGSLIFNNIRQMRERIKLPTSHSSTLIINGSIHPCVCVLANRIQFQLVVFFWEQVKAGDCTCHLFLVVKDYYNLV
jgi:hypothetical protein